MTRTVRINALKESTTLDIKIRIDIMMTRIIEDIIKHIDKSELNMEPSKIKSLLQSAIKKADLVSRDEFDTQSAVLLRTRMRLQNLEEQLSHVEVLLENQTKSS